MVADGCETETLRLSCWLTAEECAEAAGVCTDTLARMEKGLTVKPESVRAVAGVLGVDPRRLASSEERRVSLRVVA